MNTIEKLARRLHRYNTWCGESLIGSTEDTIWDDDSKYERLKHLRMAKYIFEELRNIPTEEMIAAAHHYSCEQTVDPKETWQQMIDEALK